MMTSSQLLAEAQFKTYFELAPLIPVSEWWHALLIGVLLIVVVTISIALYFFDSIELKAGVSLTLGLLRMAAIVGIVVFFLNPERLSQKQIIKNTRVPVLIDTSSSMAGRDLDPQTGQPTPKRRIDQVLDAVIPEADPRQVSLIEQLQETNDVVLYRFDEQARPELVASFASKRKMQTPEEALEDAKESQLADLYVARVLATIAAIAMVVGIGLCIAYAWFALKPSNFSPTVTSFLLTSGVVLVMSAIVLLAVADLRASDSSLLVIAGFEEFEARVPDDLTDDEDEDAPVDDIPAIDSPTGGEDQSTGDLRSRLAATGAQSRIGDAIADVVRRERGRPVAGMFVFTDGQKTAGVEIRDAARAASENGIRVFPVGIGSPNRPRDVRIVELQAPQRVFPQDKFLVKGIIQSFGYEGQSALIELLVGPPDSPDDRVIESSSSVTLPKDGEPIPFEFEVDSGSKGQRSYQVRIVPNQEDLSTSDNYREVTVDIIDRENVVLLIAGGPNRDYRFLRNQLYRDEVTKLHVYLQTAQPGVAQESDEMLFEFPRLKEELFQYDCIVAFDPDWRELDEEQAKLLEEWVAEQAGGLIVIAGPVFTPKWTRRARGDATIDVIRRLYPVSFFNQGSASYAIGRFGGDSSFPLRFSREGRSAPFLWIQDTALESQTAWDEFAGVYGYYAVNEPKAGAVIYAEFSDPATSIDGKLPIYFAGQFYGAGRSFFQASAEMWRLRAEDVEFFEQYYTKLIHWVSQGRLMRDSRRGVLIADKSRCLKGDPITIQALLRDAQDRPLELPEIDVVVTQPDGSAETITLQGAGSENRTGAYIARYLPQDEGNYRVKYVGLNEDKALSLEFTVEIPLFEQQRSERNDEVLLALAEVTEGEYVTDVNALVSTNQNSNNAVMLVRANEDQLYRVYLPPTTDDNFRRSLVIWMLLIVVAALCLEWTIRRLHRLA